MVDQASSDSGSVIEVVHHQQHRTLLHTVTTPATDPAQQLPATVTFTYMKDILMLRAKFLTSQAPLEELMPISEGKVRDFGHDVRFALTEFAKAHRATYLDLLPSDGLLERFRTFEMRASWKTPRGLVDPQHLDRWARIANSPELRKLAVRGSDLFKAVFGEGKIADFVRTLEPGTRLEIQGPSTEQWMPLVPWGLLYRGDPHAAINPDDFLGLGFRVEYGRALGNDWLGNPGAAVAGNILFWGSEDPYDTPAMTEAERQRAVFAGWSAPRQVFCPSSDGAGKLRQVVTFLQKPDPSPVSVVYMYGHTEPENDKTPALRLGQDGEELQSVADWMVGGTPLEGNPLVFVNACSSSTGSGGYRNRFAAQFRERGCNAYIGTEAAVPAILASHVSVLFFNLFYRHTVPVPVAAGEALAQVRRFLWEEYRNIGGLFYSYIDKYDVYLADQQELYQRQRLQTALFAYIEQTPPQAT